MPYLYLAVAIAAEILGTSQLKHTQNFTKPLPSIICILAYGVCYYTFTKSLNWISLGVAYALWCGIGIVVTTAISYFFFQERLSAAGIFGIVLIVVGCVILNLFGTPKA